MKTLNEMLKYSKSPHTAISDYYELHPYIADNLSEAYDRYSYLQEGMVEWFKEYFIKSTKLNMELDIEVLGERLAMEATGFGYDHLKDIEFVLYMIMSVSDELVDAGLTSAHLKEIMNYVMFTMKGRR